MAYEDLNETDIKLYEYINAHDFMDYPWSTPAAVEALGITEEEVRAALINLMKHYKGKVYVHYEDGAIRIDSE